MISRFIKTVALCSVVLFSSCKNETTSINEIEDSVVELWKSYVDAHPKLEDKSLPDSWFFHSNKADANRLGELVLKGKKKAGSGLYSWYKDANADLPKIGTKHIITDFDGKALAIIEIRKVDTIAFNKISKTYASLDMGTSEKPLEKWKKAHWDFFESALKEEDKTPTEDMLVVCEWFETIWPANAVEY